MQNNCAIICFVWRLKTKVQGFQKKLNNCVINQNVLCDHQSPGYQQNCKIIV